jgi:hypothetical protein
MTPSKRYSQPNWYPFPYAMFHGRPPEDDSMSFRADLSSSMLPNDSYILIAMLR